jgi:hypothetical protein
MDKYLDMMNHFSAGRGKLIGVKYGEGFRQHLGHSYPQEDILLKELGETVHEIGI